MRRTEDGVKSKQVIRVPLLDQRCCLIVVLSIMALLNWGALWVHSRRGFDHGHDAAPVMQVAINLGMWAAMMGAMMFPVVLPTVLRLHGSRPNDFGPAGPRIVFSIQLLAGWLAVWSAYSAGAAAFQAYLHQLGWLNSPMGRVDPRLGAMLLVAAGGWQMTGWKRRCAGHCDFSGRPPARSAQVEADNAFRRGLLFGLHCVGSCWALMLLMFVGGVMNLWWMAGLTLYLLLERLAAKSFRLVRAAGIILTLTGFAWVTGSEQRDMIEWCGPVLEPAQSRGEAG